MSGLIYILNYIDILGPLIALLFFLVRRDKLPPELKLVQLFCWVQLACNLYASILDIADKNNYWVYEINALLSIGIALILFGKYLLDLKKGIIITLVSLLIICNLFSYRYFGGLSTFNSYGHALCSLVIVLLSLYFFYSKLINMPEEVSIPDTSIFWCVVGIFTYYAGAFFIFISYKYLLTTDSSNISILWRFHNVLLFICCAYISYGVLCKNYRTILS